MSDTTIHTPAGADAPASAGHADEHIHMPSPSFSPIVLALGLTILGFGLAFGAVAIALGAIITVIGLGTWIADDIAEGSRHSAADEAQPH